MKPIVIYLQAYLIYLLLSLPSMIFPPMYFLSAAFAFGFGIASCVIFAIVYFIIRHMDISAGNKMLILVFTVPVAVAVGHTLIGVFNFEENVWDLNLFLCFPASAVISGWISIYINRKSLREEFSAENEERFITV